jgi:hypothetical protein
MKASDLNLITQCAKSYPDLLPHMLFIYRMGYKQGQIDDLREYVHGINYGNEMLPNN